MNVVGVGVGVGVIVVKDGKVLAGKRINMHGGNTSHFPGGHLEFMETFESCAKRETQEEAGIEIENVRFVAVTNDFFEIENKHYITIFMMADYASGEVQNLEPHKCEGWDWYVWDEIPEPLMPPLENLRRMGIRPLESISVS